LTGVIENTVKAERGERRPFAIRYSLFTILLALSFLATSVQGCATLRAERNAPPIGRFVEVENQRLHVVDLSPKKEAGPPVVLIHGASVNLRDLQMPLAGPLSERHRVVLVDRPGRGYSSRPADGWRLERQAELIHAALRELNVERPVIVGQSFGGAVALAYALRYPQELSGLALIAPVSHEWPGRIAWYYRVSQWPAAGVLFRRLVIPAYAPLAAPKGVVKSFAPDIPPEGYFENTGLALLFRPKDFRANAQDIAHLKAQVREMSRRYGEIRVPTAIVTGASDTVVSPEIHSLALASTIPNARLELLPDTGHALHHSETAKVVAAIESVAQ
jgi:pimeloyl-ACP methyl ester carboxylesterase